MHHMEHIWTLKICKHTFYASLSRIWKMMQFTGLIRKVFATKILLSGKFLLFVTLHRGDDSHCYGHNRPCRISRRGGGDHFGRLFVELCSIPSKQQVEGKMSTEERLLGSSSRQSTNLVFMSVSRLTLLWLPQPVRASQVPFHLLNCPPLPPPSPTTTTTHWNTPQNIQIFHKNVNKTTHAIFMMYHMYELTSFTLKLLPLTPTPNKSK